MGDVLCFFNTGAYVSYLSDRFNGFKPCSVYFTGGDYLGADQLHIEHGAVEAVSLF